MLLSMKVTTINTQIFLKFSSSDFKSFHDCLTMSLNVIIRHPFFYHYTMIYIKTVRNIVSLRSKRFISRTNCLRLLFISDMNSSLKMASYVVVWSLFRIRSRSSSICWLNSSNSLSNFSSSSLLSFKYHST